MPKRKDQDGLYRRPNSPYWWVTYTDGCGKRARRSTGTGNRAKAKVIRAQWELEAEEERRSGPPAPKPKGPTFDEMMLHYMEGPGAEKRSAERDYYSAKQLYPHFSGRKLSTLGAVDVRDYIAARKVKGVGPGTINRELGLLSAALNWARKDLEWDVANPAQGRRLKEPEGRVRWITRDEATKLIDVAATVEQAPHLCDLIILGLHTGMRRNEMLGLEWRRVDLQAGLVYLEAEHQKSGKVGSVPLNTEARQAILSRSNFRAQHCPAAPWVFCNRKGVRIASVKKSFATACKAAGIEDFHLHDLRHTCAAWLVQEGVPLPEIRDLLRHSTIKVTERYAHLAPHNVREAVNRLSRHTERVTLTAIDERRATKSAATG
jgi:integrase